MFVRPPACLTRQDTWLGGTSASTSRTTCPGTLGPRTHSQRPDLFDAQSESGWHWTRATNALVVRQVVPALESLNSAEGWNDARGATNTYGVSLTHKWSA